eukprot:2545752-Rhodomonas_salina.3
MLRQYRRPNAIGQYRCCPHPPTAQPTARTALRGPNGSARGEKGTSAHAPVAVFEVVLVLAIVAAAVGPGVHAVAVHLVLEIVALVAPPVRVRQHPVARALALHPRAPVHPPVPPRHIPLPCLHPIQILP